MKFPVLSIFICLLLVSTFVNAQEPQLIDEIDFWSSEEFEARLDSAIIELSKHPDAKIQLLIHRGENRSFGSPFKLFASVKAYVKYHNIAGERFISTFCEAKPEQTMQIWLLTSSERKDCTPEDIRITDTTKFDTGYPVESPSGCCISDSFGPIMAEASLNAFAEVLKRYPDSTAYVFVYGGTNVYWTSYSKGREKEVRRVDKKRDVKKLLRKAENTLIDAGIDRARIISISAGYKDSPASIDMWIVPAGGEIPIPSPNYFPKNR